MPTILVADSTGAKTITAEVLASFTADVGFAGERFRFVVTALLDSTGARILAPLALTHRESGMRVVAIDGSQLGAALRDYLVAGKAALARLIEQKGAARVASALRTAEARAAQESAQ